MTEPTADAAIANLNARIDMLSSQVLQIAQMAGSNAERQQANNREVINYVTQKVDELTNVVAELQGTSNGHVAEPVAAEAIRAGGRGRREGTE